MATTINYTILDGEVLSQSVGGVTHDYLSDPQGNTVALLDSNQNITDTFTYWPYGEERARTGTTSVPFRYGGGDGYYHDPSTNKLYVRARYLDVAKGRWQTADPLGYGSGDWNIYRYAANAPIHHSDPSGLYCECTNCKQCHYQRKKGDDGGQYDSCIQNAISKYCGNAPGVNDKLVRCMIFAESTGRRGATNGPARGIMQIKAGTWGRYCSGMGSYSRNWRNACTNITCGVKILCQGYQGSPCGPNGYGTDCHSQKAFCCCVAC